MPKSGIERSMSTRDLRSTLQELSSKFANAIFDAIGGATLEELLSASKGGSAAVRNGAPSVRQQAKGPGEEARTPRRIPRGRLARRSPEQIAQAVAQVVALVKKHKDGLRSEEIRAELGMQSKELPRVLREGVAKKLLKSKGQKRATRYSAR